MAQTPLFQPWSVCATIPGDWLGQNCDYSHPVLFWEAVCSSTQKLVWPGLLSNAIWPFIRFTSALEIARPRPKASSGFSHLFGGKPLVSNIRMASYSFDANGFFTVTLEDGEIWQESSSWPTLAKWKLPPASYYVSILPGLLGSYDLKVRGMNGYFKVHRLH